MSMSYAANKLRIPPGFEHLLEGLAREILREQPKNLIEFAAQYFQNKLQERDGEVSECHLPLSAMDQTSSTLHPKAETQEAPAEPVLSELASGEDIPQAAQREEESTAQDNEVQEEHSQMEESSEQAREPELGATGSKVEMVSGVVSAEEDKGEGETKGVEEVEKEKKMEEGGRDDVEPDRNKEVSDLQTTTEGESVQSTSTGVKQEEIEMENLPSEPAVDEPPTSEFLSNVVPEQGEMESTAEEAMEQTAEEEKRSTTEVGAERKEQEAPEADGDTAGEGETAGTVAAGDTATEGDNEEMAVEEKEETEIEGKTEETVAEETTAETEETEGMVTEEKEEVKDEEMATEADGEKPAETID